MTLCTRWMLVGVLVVLSGAIKAPAQGQAQAACDRACLGTMLDQYLAAVVKHDPKGAPLAVGFRQTENAINVPPGGRRLEDRDRTGQDAAPVLRPRQRPGRVLRADR